ncbi:MAG: RsmB/NOP family class I SAM-dependent RNA methyltransferase [Burkholderiaceae bacterium]|jgi:16S rRNA (cytosine967-C5)-methyltransferase|nr:RsmB/NOP family class I SAM-dependent RNA methyltransferase [Burkholderiaceae bacterium]
MHSRVLLDLAADLLRQVLLFEHPADATVARFFRKRNTGSGERARLADAVYDVLRRRALYAHWAEFGAAGQLPPEALSMPQKLAWLALDAQAAASGGAPDAAAQDFPQAGGDADALARLNAWRVACQRADLAALPPECRHNLPAWLASALRAQVGDAFDALAQSLLQPAGLDLRVNVLKQKRPAVQRQLAQAGIGSEDTPYCPWGLRVAGKPSLAGLSAWQQGAIEVQDEGSQLLALLLQARRGELVVDFCAGAGGKTLALGAAMRNTGRLYAFDTSANRLDALKPRLLKSGLDNVHTAAIAHERDTRVKALAGKADRVLVDAPCSGLGTLRRAPDLKWRATPESVAQMALRQAAILQSAAQLVKPGGRLLYATCSLLQEENEAVANAFGAAARRDFRPLDAAQTLAALKVPQADALATPAGHLRLWPHQHGTDGFFAAIWQRL